MLNLHEMKLTWNSSDAMKILQLDKHCRGTHSSVATCVKLIPPNSRLANHTAVCVFALYMQEKIYAIHLNVEIDSIANCDVR